MINAKWLDIDFKSLRVRIYEDQIVGGRLKIYENKTYQHQKTTTTYVKAQKLKLKNQAPYSITK